MEGERFLRDIVDIALPSIVGNAHLDFADQ
jgi:hypothetical protein